MISYHYNSSKNIEFYLYFYSLILNHQVLDRFRDGLEKILVTTNVMARGIDVEQVTIVVNYDMPTEKDETTADCETYLHRIGRTGRFGKHGLAINLIDSEKSLNILNEIERHFQKPIIKLDAQDMDAIEKIQKD